MELVTNRVSGKPFILLDDAGDSHFLLITPEGKVKRLERHLFGHPLPDDQNHSKWYNHLTREQIDKYTEHIEYVDY